MRLLPGWYAHVISESRAREIWAAVFSFWFRLTFREKCLPRLKLRKLVGLRTQLCSSHQNGMVGLTTLLGILVVGDFLGFTYELLNMRRCWACSLFSQWECSDRYPCLFFNNKTYCRNNESRIARIEIALLAQKTCNSKLELVPCVLEGSLLWFGRYFIGLGYYCLESAMKNSHLKNNLFDPD